MKSHMLLFSIEECKLRLFWVVTWLVYDNFEFGAKNGPELPRNDQKWSNIVQNGKKRWWQNSKRLKLIYLISPMAPYDRSRVTGLVSCSEEVKKGQKSNFAIVKKSSWIRGTKLLPPLIWPKNRFPVVLGQIKEGVFEKNPLAYTPCLAQNNHFWPPEEPFLAKNLENKVFLAHTIENFTILNPNVAPKKVTILGPTDTPWHPPGVQGGPKCIPSSLMMIQGVSKNGVLPKWAFANFSTNIMSISSQLAAGSPNARFGKTQFVWDTM